MGAVWVRLSLQAFFRRPLATVWVCFSSLMPVVLIASALPAVLGGVLISILLPAITLGLMIATAQIVRPGKPTPAAQAFITALQALRTSVKPLAILGGGYVVTTFVIVSLPAVLDGGTVMRMFLLGQLPASLEVTRGVRYLAALGLTLFLWLLNLLVFGYAAALAHWCNMLPAKSVFFGFMACIRNIKALTVYGLLWLGVNLVLSAILFMLISVIMTALPGSAGGGRSPLIGVLMLADALVFCSMFFSSIWFTFRDSFSAT